MMAISMKMRSLFLLLGLFLGFITNTLAIIPLPARIYGFITVNGAQLTQQSAGNDYVISVRRLNNSNFSPLATINTLNSYNAYIIDIPHYEQSDQPGGATTGEQATIHISYRGTELQIISPLNGQIAVGAEGSVSLWSLTVMTPVVTTTPTTTTIQPSTTTATSTTTSSTNVFPSTTLGSAGSIYSVDSIVGNLRYVPPGTFTQGAPSAEVGSNSNEKPQFQHTLTNNLAVMETEVTQRMWANLKDLQPTLPEDPSQLTTNLSNPVEQVTWYQAVLFANLLSMQRGLTRVYYLDPGFSIPIDSTNHQTNTIYAKWDTNGYRLPTEGEWEYFTRAGTSWPFSINEPNYNSTTSGNCAAGVLTALESVAWYQCNSNLTTHPVGGKLANPWGFRDVHGNVSEWCWDLDGTYPTGPQTDYHGASTGSVSIRIIRGGNFYHIPGALRSSCRGNSDAANVLYLIGFRLLRAINVAGSPTTTLQPTTTNPTSTTTSTISVTSTSTSSSLRVTSSSSSSTNPTTTMRSTTSSSTVRTSTTSSTSTSSIRPSTSTTSSTNRVTSSTIGSSNTSSTSTSTSTSTTSTTIPSDYLLLNNKRFRVSVYWRDYNNNKTGPGIAIPLTSDSGCFWFFSPGNIELVIKILDGRWSNGHFWVMYGALSDVEYRIHVLDTSTGETKEYYNPPKTLSSKSDIFAFPKNATSLQSDQANIGIYGLFADRQQRQLSPDDYEGFSDNSNLKESTNTTCIPSATVLCLNNNRFRVQVNWRNYSNGLTGSGKAVPFSAGSGESGYFWFFNKDNVELLIKILDGRWSNGYFWLMYGALSDVEYTITVTDMITGATREYNNPAHNIAGAKDLTTFSDNGLSISTTIPVVLTSTTTTTSTTIFLGSSTTSGITTTTLGNNWAGQLCAIDSIVGNLRYVPPGTFLQGTPNNEAGRSSDEGPRFQHTLTKPIAVMETAVTRKMWADLRAVQSSLREDPTCTDVGWGNNNPVQCFSWESAILFSNLLSQQQGLQPVYFTDSALTSAITAANYGTYDVYVNWNATGFRLPTEGEREYFTRAGTTGPFSIDEPAYNVSTFSSCTSGVLPALESVSWFCANYEKTTHPVGSKIPNPWGLTDVHGNVGEWCWDWLGNYPSTAQTDYRGPSTGKGRVFRGGMGAVLFGHSRYPFNVRSGGTRNGLSGGNAFLGFRLVRTVI